MPSFDKPCSIGRLTLEGGGPTRAIRTEGMLWNPAATAELYGFRPEEAKDENIGDEVMIIVEDTVVGIDPEVLPSVFTPIFTTRANGLGLGLSNNVVEQNRGRISIESTKGKGPVVTYAFPKREE